MQNSKLRTILGCFRLYSLGCKTSLLKDTMIRLQKDNNDRGVSVLTSVFFKRLFVEESEHIRTLLELARDFWFMNTLDSLRDDKKYILDILASTQQSMALLIYLLMLEKKQNIQPPLLRSAKSLRNISKTYLSPLVQIIQAGMDSVLADILKLPHATDALEA